MQRILRSASQLPLLINEFFRHMHGGGRLKVFLCGKEQRHRHIDDRLQTKVLVDTLMGCRAFLGEEIEGMNSPKANDSALSLELTAAEKSDLILMYLGSPGTFAEVTAFAMTRSVNPKTVVFNEAIYKGQRTFVNMGPLQLLTNPIIYYDGKQGVTSKEVVREVDVAVARAWWQKGRGRVRIGLDLEFSPLVALLLIYAAYPVRYAALVQLMAGDRPGANERAVKSSLKRLFGLGLIKKEESKYLPTSAIDELSVPAGLVSDVCRARAKLMASRFKDEEVVGDYRLAL